jgi:HSP20 family protein
MGNIMVRRESTPGLAPRREWEPFQLMHEFLKFDPFREMAPTWWMGEERMTFWPNFEIKETKDGYVFLADVPGIAEKDLEVTLVGNRLTVKGRREVARDEKAETFYVYERTYGDFTRTFTLPDGADFEHITTRLDAGVLTLFVPKQAATQPKKIALNVESKTKA